MTRTHGTMRRGAALAAAAAAVLLAGCGQSQGDAERVGAAGPTGATDPSGPLTARAVAAVALEHLPTDTTGRAAATLTDDGPAGAVGADLDYDAAADGQAELVTVSVSPGRTVQSCSPDVQDCADLGEGLVLRWRGVPVDEEPGAYSVQTERDGAMVSAVASGPLVSGDPRAGAAARPTVDQLVAVVSDPRLAPTASAEVLSAAEGLTGWRGGETDATLLERVPHTDATLTAGFLSTWGQAWTYAGRSPAKELFGDDAVGGRARVSDQTILPGGPGLVDVLAAPVAPGWIEPDECLEGYRCRTVDGLHVVWRPASGDDAGASYLVRVDPGTGEVVAVRAEGRPMAEDLDGVLEASGYYLWGQEMASGAELALGLTATRESVAFAEEELAARTE